MDSATQEIRVGGGILVMAVLISSGVRACAVGSAPEFGADHAAELQRSL